MHRYRRAVAPIIIFDAPPREYPEAVIATLYVVITRLTDPASLATLLRVELADRVDVLAAVSERPNDCGAAVRLLGPASEAVHSALRTAWNAARRESTGIPAPNLRKG